MDPILKYNLLSKSMDNDGEKKNQTRFSICHMVPKFQLICIVYALYL